MKYFDKSTREIQAKMTKIYNPEFVRSQKLRTYSTLETIFVFREKNKSKLKRANCTFTYQIQMLTGSQSCQY